MNLTFLIYIWSGTKGVQNVLWLWIWHFQLTCGVALLVTAIPHWWWNVLWTWQFQLTWDMASLVTLVLVTVVRGWWSNVLWTGQFQLTWDMAMLLTAVLGTEVRGWWSNVLWTGQFQLNETCQWWQQCWRLWWEAGDQMFYEPNSFNSHETLHHWWQQCWQLVRGWWSNVLWTRQFQLTWDMASLVTAAMTLVTMVRGWWSNVLWIGQFQLTWDMASLGMAVLVTVVRGWR